jgi:hypothetical protein
MRRLGFGLVLLGMAVTAQAAQPESIVFVPKLDLLTVQPVQFDADGLARTPRYRFTASIELIHPADAAPFGLGFNSTSRLTPAVEPQKETAWAPDANWTRFFDSDRTSLSPRLRYESKGQQLEVRPRVHSVWIQWRKELP